MDTFSTPGIYGKDTARETKQNQNISRNKSIQSPDLLIKQSTHGTSITLRAKHKRFWGNVIYKSEYDPNARYAVNDMIRVLGGKTYTDYSGHVTPAVAGVWICVFDVPDLKLSDAIIALGQSATYPYQVRTNGVLYYPRNPEPTNLATYSVPNGRYWETISLFC